jgi:hypothetical protein
MSSVSNIMKIFDIDRETAVEIQNIIQQQQENDSLQFLPPSNTSSMSYASSFDSNYNSCNKRNDRFNFLKRVMPWPFLFIK